MTRKFERVGRGMSMEQVTAVLGTPDETSRLTFGNETLTTWIYHTEGEPAYVWFGEDGTVKIMSVK